MSETKEHGEGKSSSETETVLNKAMSFCFSEEFSEIFEHFMRKHWKHFEASIDEDYGNDHTQEQKAIFDEYLLLFETTVDQWLDESGISQQEFYTALKEARLKDDDEISGQNFFLKLLQASTEFESFFEVMKNEARFQVWKADEKK